MSIVESARAISRTVSGMSDDITRSIRMGAAQSRDDLTEIAISGKQANQKLGELWSTTGSTSAESIHRNLASSLDTTNQRLFDAVANIGVDPQATLASLRAAGSAADEAERAARQLSNVAPLI